MKIEKVYERVVGEAFDTQEIMTLFKKEFEVLVNNTRNNLIEHCIKGNVKVNQLFTK